MLDYQRVTKKTGEKHGDTIPICGRSLDSQPTSATPPIDGMDSAFLVVVVGALMSPISRNWLKLENLQDI